MRRFRFKIDRRYAKVCLYASVTTLVTFVCAMLLWYSSGFLSKLWSLTRAVMLPLIVGAAISYLLNPPVTYVSRWLARVGFHPENGKRRRRVAVIAVVVGLALFLLAVLGLLLALVNHSLSGVTLDMASELLDSAQGDLSKLLERIERAFSEIGFEVDALETITGVVGEVKNFAQAALFSIIFAVYFLLDGDAVFRYLERLVNAAFGSGAMFKVALFFSDADRVFSGYIRGQAIDALVVGALSAASFTAIGIPFGAVVGVLTGLGNLIPYVGGPVGYLSVILVCLADEQMGKMVAGVVVLTLIMLIDANIINPRLLSENVEVHPLLVMAALIAGGAVGGVVGMLVAVPVAAFVKVKIDAWIKQREAVTGE